MLGGGVAKRYAQALFDLTEEKNILPKTEQDLLAIRSVIVSSEDFSKLLYHPRINISEKKAFLHDIFQNQLSETATDFLDYVIEKNREMYLLDIIDEYIRLSDEARNIAKVTVYSAFALDESELNAINNRMNQMIKKETVIEAEVQPDLIGGIVVRIGDTVYDASIKNNLNRLHNQLKQI